jgi:pyruvate/2-oxoglutarate dehydrogenase complex dihydrolipoamide acyltransferase (E2) component
MENTYSFRKIPRSRIASFDVFAVGLEKHHVSAMVEFDVTESRKKLQELRRRGTNISFNAWIIKVISNVLQQHPEASAFLYSKKKLMIFDDIDISMLVEKKIAGNRVPIPVVIRHTNKKSAQEITAEIENAREQELSDKEVVINKRTALSENFYYRLPGFMRRTIWRLMLRNPRFIYGKMGNAAVTSVGMIGHINGWFIHRSVHPVSFGVGSILKKPVVIKDQIAIREILNMTILIDHDVIDGAPMVRMLNDLTKSIESGDFI